MKFLILLAFLATANAAVYSGCPHSYSYFQRCNWYIPLPSTCWHFRIHYCQQWYTTKYYAPILKVYPSDTCGQPGWKEMSEDDFRSECAGKLSEARAKILAEIRVEYYKFLNDLNALINSYCNAQYEAVYKYYQPLIDCADYATRIRLIRERDEYIRKYKTDLYNKANEVFSNYLEGINKRIASVDEFHKKILDASMKCFNTRKEKIAQYTKELGERMYNYLVEFKTKGLEIARKNRDSYRELLHKINGENWEEAKVNAVLDQYWRKMYYDCINKGSVYYRGLLDLKDKLVSYYACNYRCATYSGCLNFYQRNYYKSCKSLGAWWVYKLPRYSCYKYVNYSYQWKPCVYKNLRTCDLRTVNLTADQFKASIQPQVDAAIAAAEKALQEWTDKWNRIHSEYIAKFRQILQERHDFLLRWKKDTLTCYYQGWTYQAQAEYDAWHRDLDARLNREYYDYIAKLKEQRESAIASFKKTIESYKARLADFVKQVVARYQACLDTRSKRISEYYSKQIEIRNKLRANLVKKLNDIRDLKVLYFTKMLNFYHCNYLNGAPTELLAAYKARVEAENRSILYRFDAHWRTTLYRLYYHYACGYKCTSKVKIAIPTFRCTQFNWKISYPTQCCYTYMYRCYTRYYNYHCQRINGCYVYVAK